MELMDTSLDKFYRKVLEKNMTIPEDILGEIAVSVSGCGTQEQSQGPSTARQGTQLSRTAPIAGLLGAMLVPGFTPKTP